MSHYKTGSDKDDWSTPQSLFDKLNSEFHFDLDACASAQTAKCKHYFSASNSALTKDWKGSVFINPPYGRRIVQFVRKVCEQRRNCNVIVGLLPSRTDAQWWHQYVIGQASEIRFTVGRVGYVDPLTGERKAANITFGSAVVVWMPFDTVVDVSSLYLPKGSGRR